MPRDWSLTYGKDGFQLNAWDVAWRYWLADKAVDGLMNLLGHPCCGKGLLGRVPFTDLMWFKLINLPCKLWRLNREVIRFPVTDEQARVINPEFVKRLEDEDEDE